jgi:hypothetical protein
MSLKKFFNTSVYGKSPRPPRERHPLIKEITFDPSYSQLITNLYGNRGRRCPALSASQGNYSGGDRS